MLKLEERSGMSHHKSSSKIALVVALILTVLVVVWSTHGSNSASRHAHLERHAQTQAAQSQTEEAKADVADWVLVTRQVAGHWFPASTKTTGLLNENNPSGPAYCILGRLENYRRNGKFHFRLKWPSLNREQEWKQSVNPFSDHTLYPPYRGVPGYEAVSNVPPVSGEYWKGLMWGQGGYALLTSYGPWYAVGSFYGINIRGHTGAHINSFGGPVDSRAGKIVNEVELYVYSPSQTTTPPPIPTQPPQPPTKPCFPCGVMMKSLCDASKKCTYSGNYCRCRNLQTDFVFLVDASGSVGSSGFDFEKQIVDTMLANLPADSRVGVVRFGDAATAVSKLSGGQSIDQVRADVMEMVYHAGESTHMGEAVQMALGADYLLNRQRTRLRMVLLTDGISNGLVDPCDPSLVGEIQGKSGLEVIVIGVTNQFSAGSVECLVSNRNKYIVEAKDLTLNSFASVWSHIDSLICPAPSLGR